MAKDTLLEIRGLRVEFSMFEGVNKAVDNLSLTVKNNQVIGIIGESGSGKSVTAQSIMQIVPQPPGRIVSGEILYHGGRNQQKDAPPTQPVDILKVDKLSPEMCHIRGNEISMIFQEPMTSFGPLFTIGRQISEVILTHEPTVTKQEAKERSVEMLDAVGIPKPEKVFSDYPHQLSGGMRQRAMIAMALVCNPRLLLADEPTTALDVTVQAQILKLLKSMQERTNMSMLYITHNLAVVSEIADVVAAMYLGNLMEVADVRTIGQRPLHPYTRALWASIPQMKGERRKLHPIRGIMPSLSEVSGGCVFAGRCEQCMPGVCDLPGRPPLYEAEPNHFVSCYMYGKDA